ncbi:MAG: hypothetical protein QOJ85_2687 [Solirubrobacteraceae bacterium]|jgi:uncharacterized protein YkwD|nr:hypothetical protein [Solirubrobacteraceae bacterium]MEA2241183.1 hypothetical protein [Solirubrobacteraceae bacterium]
MLRRGSFAGIIAVLAGVLVLHVGVSTASRKSRGACEGTNVIPVDEATRRQAASAVICLVNLLRARYDMRRVRVSYALTETALQHSDDMVRQTYFSHDAPSEPFSVRMSRTDYARVHRRCTLSEAMAWGTNATARVLVRMLRRSPEHRAILLDPAQRDMGIGLALGAPERDVRTASSTLVLTFGH